MKSEEFDKIIKEKLLSNNTPPPANGWESISAQVGEGSQWAGWKIITAIILLLGLGGSGTYYFASSEVEPLLVIQDEVTNASKTGTLLVQNEQQVSAITTSTENSAQVKTTTNNQQLSNENSNTAQIESIDTYDDNESSLASPIYSINDNNDTEEVHSTDEIKIDQPSNKPIYKLLPKSFEEKVTFTKADIRKVGLPIVAAEEEEVKPVIEKNHLISGVYIDAQSFLNYNRIKPNLNDDVLVSSLKNNKFNERVGFNFSAGIHKKITPRLSWYTGLVYQTYISKVQYTYQNRTADSVSVSLENGVYTATPNVVEYKDVLEQRVNSIGLESGLKYLIPGRNFNNVFNAGLFGTTAINGKRLDYLSNQQLFLKFGYGAYYDTKTPWTIFAQPSLSYSLLSENKDAGIFHIQPFSLGLTIGVTYRFVK